MGVEQVSVSRNPQSAPVETERLDDLLLRVLDDAVGRLAWQIHQCGRQIDQQSLESPELLIGRQLRSALETRPLSDIGPRSNHMDLLIRYDRV